MRLGACASPLWCRRLDRLVRAVGQRAGRCKRAASRARVVMRCQSPAATASAGVSHEPPTQATLGRARKSAAVVGGDAAGGAEGDVGERSAQRLEHADAAGLLAGKQLHLGEARGACSHDLRRRHHAGQQRQAAVARACHQLGRQAGADAEHGAGLERSREVLRARDRADADDGTGDLARRWRAWPRSATGVRSVTSSTRTPPATSALASGTACSMWSMTMTGITGPMRISSRTFFMRRFLA